jgi:hypothetical protein
MNIKRYAITAIALFVFTTAFDFLVHGILLKEAYTSTSNLWRPEAEMESYMGLMFLTQLAFSAAFAFIFTRNYEGRGIGEGARYGLYLGGLLAILEVQRYCYLPVPFSLPLSWALSAIVWGVLAGVILSLLYREEAPA